MAVNDTIFHYIIYFRLASLFIINENSSDDHKILPTVSYIWSIVSIGTHKVKLEFIKQDEIKGIWKDLFPIKLISW